MNAAIGCPIRSPSAPAGRLLAGGQAWTAGATRRVLSAEFAAAGLDSPDLDARVLLAYALGLDHAALVALSDRPLGAAEIERIEELAARRLKREPVARIVGVKEFWGLPIGLGPATLVPRPDTETVVETALDALDAEGLRTERLRLADLGTGSGAILLALLSELPRAYGVGTDLDVAALATARANARELGFEDRAAFLACDFAAALAGGFDLVVANPPYVRSGEIESLEPEVRDHDPRLALDGGRDGLSSFRTLAREMPRLLAPRGHLVIELGAGQSAAVASLFRNGGRDGAIEVRRDLSGVERVLHIKAK